MCKKFFVLILMSVFIFLASQVAQASGFGYYEHSARAAAMANAFVALADDASAIYYNPAGLVYVTQPVVMTSFGTTTVKITANSTGGVEESLSPVQVQIDAYAARALTDRIHIGIGVFSPYTMNNKFSPEWPGRYQMVQSEISSRYFRPAVAFKISDRFAIGAGLDIVHGYMLWYQNHDLQFIDNALDEVVGQRELYSTYQAEGWGYGFSLGALFQVSDQLRFGVRYQHDVEMDLEADDVLKRETMALPFGTISDGERSINLNNVTNLVTFDSPSRSKLVFPAEFAIGAFYRPSNRLNLVLDLLWTNWSAVDGFGFETSTDNADYTREADRILAPSFRLGPTNFQHHTMELNWEDTISLLLGAEYVASQDIVLRAGYAHYGAVEKQITSVPVLLGYSRDEITAGIGFLNQYGVEKQDRVQWQADIALKYALISDLSNTGVFLADYDFSDWSLVVGFKLKFGMKY